MGAKERVLHRGGGAKVCVVRPQLDEEPGQENSANSVGGRPKSCRRAQGRSGPPAPTTVRQWPLRESVPGERKTPTTSRSACDKRRTQRGATRRSRPAEPVPERFGDERHPRPGLRLLLGKRAALDDDHAANSESRPRGPEHLDSASAAAFGQLRLDLDLGHRVGNALAGERKVERVAEGQTPFVETPTRAPLLHRELPPRDDDGIGSESGEPRLDIPPRPFSDGDDHRDRPDPEKNADRRERRAKPVGTDLPEPEPERRTYGEPSRRGAHPESE